MNRIFSVRSLSINLALLFVSTHFLANLYVIGEYSFNKILTGLALIVWVIKKTGDLAITREKNPYFHQDRGILLTMAGFIGVSMLGLLWSYDAADAVRERFVPVFTNFFVFMMLVDILKSEELIERFMKWLVLSTIIYAVFNLLQYFGFLNLYLLTTREIRTASEMPRLVGLQQDPNYNGFMFVPIFPMILYRLLVAKHKGIVFWGIALVLVFASIIFTYSRTMTIVTFLSITFVVVTLRISLRKKILLSSVLLAFVVVISVVPGIYERMESIGAVRQVIRSDDPSSYLYIKGESSIALRFAILTQSVVPFFENFFFGVGTGNFRDYAGRHIFGTESLSVGAHNSFLEIALENGFPGIALFMAALFLIFRHLNQVPKDRKAVSILSMKNSVLCLFISMLFLTVHQMRLFWIIMALALASANVLGRQSEQRVTRSPMFGGR